MSVVNMPQQLKHPTKEETSFAISLYALLTMSLSDYFGARGEVSKLKCIEASIHIHKDVRRLFQTHQNDGNFVLSGEVDPIKVIAFVAFWIRKSKPVSSCYH